MTPPYCQKRLRLEISSYLVLLLFYQSKFPFFKHILCRNIKTKANNVLLVNLFLFISLFKKKYILHSPRVRKIVTLKLIFTYDTKSEKMTLVLQIKGKKSFVSRLVITSIKHCSLVEHRG